jgi:hypothetical protein
MGLFFFLAVVFTKQCQYCSQKLHSYAFSFLHTASCHNYTKLNMCIWLWCVAQDCPLLWNSTLTVVILLHSMTEQVLGPYWWGRIASGLSRSWGSMTQSLHIIWSVVEINMFLCVRACVRVKKYAKFCSEYLRNRDCLEELDIAESMILKWIFEK